MKNTINIILIIACCLVGQNLMAQGATLTFNGKSYAVDFVMDLEGPKGRQPGTMSISFSKLFDGDNHAFIDALFRGTVIKNMTISQTQKNGTLRITLSNASIITFSTGESSSSKGKTDDFVVLAKRLNYEFRSSRGRNTISHSF